MYEIRIYEGNYKERHSYWSAWKNIREKVGEAGEKHKRVIVDVYYNGDHFCTMFTGYGM